MHPPKAPLCHARPSPNWVIMNRSQRRPEKAKPQIVCFRASSAGSRKAQDGVVSERPGLCFYSTACLPNPEDAYETRVVAWERAAVGGGVFCTMYVASRAVL
jgi:hypothetical protein